MNDDKLNPTPGPWRVDKDLVLGPEGYEGNIVCVAPEKTFFRSRDFWEANANLIAAAPNLLEALAFAKSVILSGEPWTETCERVIQGAINKAKGIGVE